MFTRLIAWSLQNRLLVLGLTLILCAAGSLALQHMPLDVFPEFADPQIVIQTEAPGMAPQDVETLITYPLESAINGTPGFTHVRSKTSVGLSTITVVFNANTNIYLARQLINERLQAVSNRLPAGTSPPAMMPVTSSVGWLIKYALSSDTVSLQELRTISDWQIAPHLLALGGVASVQSIGGEVRQYQVNLIPERLQAYGVTTQDVQTAIAKTNRNVPGAFLENHGQELIVGAVGRIRTLDDIKKIVITVRTGVPILVSNVADVVIGPAIKRGDGAYGLSPAVIGTVSKTYGADTLTTTRKVEHALIDIQKTLPAGVKLDTQAFRQANFIEASVHNLTRALIEGAIIVIAVIFIFLMNWRASLITFVAMPVSFIGGILVLYFLGTGINTMTLGGLAIAIGEVVDDAIITVENVIQRLQLQRAKNTTFSVLQVIFDAVYEIRSSVVYATVIIVLIFLPIFFLQGMPGRIFSPLGFAYVASVLASLIVSITTIPALCYLLLSYSSERKNATSLCIENILSAEQEIQDDVTVVAHTETPFVHWIKQHFTRLLQFSMQNIRWVIGLSCVGLLLALALLPFFGRTFLPEFHEGNYIIAMTTLPGTSLAESMRVGTQVRKMLLHYPQVVSITQRAGRSELDDDAQPPNFSEFDVRLDFSRDPSMSPNELLQHIRADLAQFPGVVFNVGQFIAHRMDEVLSGVRSQVAIKIFGDNLQTLSKLGQSVQTLLRTISGVVDINQEQQINVPQVVINIDKDKAARLGINVGDITEDIKLFLNGETVSQIIDGQRALDLTLRLDKHDRNTLSDIRNLLIDAHTLDNSGKIKLPLRAVAIIRVEDLPYAISRENVQRLTTIAFNVQDRDLSRVIEDVQTQIASQVKLPPGYHIEYGGQFESERAANRTLLIFGSLALLATLLLLHKLFGNFRDALLVMCNLPLALIGGVIALFLAGGVFSIASMVGFITLFGIAARNGIILITHYKKLATQALSLEQLILQGTLDRVVPVLMTALTAALGLLPLLFGSPVGKELQRPLAQVVLGGLVTSTLLNLIVVPTLYYALEKRRLRFIQKHPAT